MSIKSRQRYRERLSLTIDILQEKFPIAFPRKPNPKVPLAIGTAKYLYKLINKGEIDINHGMVNPAIKCWCTSLSYYAACLTQGAPRYGLNGEVIGEILDYQAQYAQERLIESMQRIKAKTENCLS